jgi:hypothetical protein
MQLFSKNPAKALESARANHAKLAQRLTEAQSTVDVRRSAAKDLARNGASDSELDKAESALRAAIDRVDTLTAALAETVVEIKEFEAEQAAAALTAQRNATGAEVEQDAAALAKAAKLYLDGAAALAKITLKVSGYVPEFSNLSMVCNAAVLETPPLLEFGDKFMHSYAEGVRGGAFPATLTAAPALDPNALVNAAPLQPAPVKPPTGKVLPLQPSLPPEVHSAFEKPTIGPPRVMATARNNLDLIARNNANNNREDDK